MPNRVVAQREISVAISICIIDRRRKATTERHKPKNRDELRSRRASSYILVLEDKQTTGTKQPSNDSVHQNTTQYKCPTLKQHERQPPRENQTPEQRQFSFGNESYAPSIGVCNCRNRGTRDKSKENKPRANSSTPIAQPHNIKCLSIRCIPTFIYKCKLYLQRVK